MVQLDFIQGYGHQSECSDERRVVISGWPAQCCERESGQRETEDMAASECEREARKRRERRDSGCAHERKERRPHSEERSAPLPPPPPLHDYNRLESERRAERLSRARRPQFGGKRRRAQARIPKQPKENDCIITTNEEGSPLSFDFVVQKSQLCEDSETLDAGALAAAVRWDANAARAERTRNDERSTAPRTPRRDQSGPDSALEKIGKKISVLKKNIAKYESEFESQNGYVITASERITDVQLTRMYETLKRLQEEKKCIKADPVEYALKVKAAKQQKERDEKLDIALKSEKSMADVVCDIEEWLEGCRQAAGRSAVPELNWTASQLAAEKSCVQRVLLRLEAARGRPPAHSAERGAARHLYERYRNVKRALASRPDTGIGTNGELATIHEHETMLFNTSVDSSSDSQEKSSDASQETPDTVLQRPPPPPKDPVVEEVPSSTSSEATPANEGLHCLGLEDLFKALSEAKLQKCVLRRSIKEYEVSFELQNSRKVQKDDKKGKEEEYYRYKGIKARIKLLNALINKQKSLSNE